MRKAKGYILLVSIITILAIGMLGAYMLSLASGSQKINRVRNSGINTYFLAESGINEAIWKLKNDPSWDDSFRKGTLKSGFSRKDVFSPGDSYTVYATSSAAHPSVAQILSVAYSSSTDYVSRRAIRTEIARATEISAVWPDAVFSGGKAGCAPGDTSGHIHIDISGDPSSYGEIELYYEDVLYAAVPFPPDFPKKELKWKDSGQVKSIQNHQTDDAHMVLSVKFDPLPQNFEIKIDGVMSAGKWDTKKGFSSPYAWEEPGACKKNPTGKGNIEAKNITLEINGRAESNNDINIDKNANVIINNASIGAANEIYVKGGAILTLNNSEQLVEIEQRGYPSVDFDSIATTSLKNRATKIYKPSEFEDELKTKTDFTGVIYVTGSLNIKNQDLTVRGILVVDGKFTMTNSGANKLKTLEDPSVSGAGIIAKEEISIDSPSQLKGLLFSYKNVTLLANSGDMTIDGAVIGWNAVFDGKAAYKISVTFNDVLVAKTLNPSLSKSPVIQVNHWEEEY